MLTIGPPEKSLSYFKWEHVNGGLSLRAHKGSWKKKKVLKPKSTVEMTRIQTGSGLGCDGARNGENILAEGLCTCKIPEAAKIPGLYQDVSKTGHG